MPEVKLKKLYMAKSMEALNDRVYVELQASPEKLLKSSKTILREAEKSDKDKDEELAYLYFMRYFSVVKNLQNHEEFKKNKKYYTSLMDSKVIKKAIIRAEELSNSLQRRYDLLGIANESEKKTILKEAEKKEKEISKVPATFPIKETVISDGFITCEKLYSLTKEKVSSFLVIDIRSKEDFAMSSMKISTLINIPEDTLKPGVTANKAGRDLDEGSRLLWGRRHTYDYIIICDYGTDSLPLTPAIVVLIDAMAMWDPGKPYRAKPCVLKGGYEMFCHTYPMLISNPRSTISSTFNSLSNCNSSLLSENFSNLNISFPDLNEGFLNTPSPTEKFLYPDTSDMQPVIPQVNRSLKPKPISHYTESKREDSQDLNHSPTSSVNDLQSVDLSTGKSFPDGVLSNTIPPTASYNHVPTNRAYGAWYSSSSSSEDENPVRRNEDYKKPVFTGTLKGDTVPKVPSRNLKPTDLLQGYDAKKRILDEGKQILEKSYNAEKNAIEKLRQIEEARKSKELSTDEVIQNKQRVREIQLRLDLEEAKKRVKEIENEYSEVSLKNKEMSSHLSQIVSDQKENQISESALVIIRQIEEKDAVKKREEEQKKLLEQVEQLRKKRKEKEKQMEEQLKKDKLEKKGKENEDPKEQKRMSRDRGLNPVEHDNQAYDRQSKSAISSRRRPGETYTTKLKTSPSSSPARGGTNLRRSHSALNLSQLNDEDGFDSSSSTSAFPNVDRSLKPFNSPRWRNVQEARLRNFEPKFGSVPPTKTGLKNLGNTCYMNSIIQCLSNTIILAKYFYQGLYSESLNPKSNQKGKVAVEFGEVVRALWCSQYRSISIYDLKSVVGRHHKPFQGYDQHDSHEFLIKFMDWLHDDLNKVRDKFPKMEEQNFENVPDNKAAQLVIERLEERDASIVRTIFYGLHRSVIVCHTCSNRSLTFEPFSVLTLSFPANGRCTLKDMLHEFYKETSIEYRCDNCRRLTNCTRKFDIWKLPPVLVIHLNRFEHDILMKKKQNFVDFPLENLNLSDYLSDPYSYCTFDLYGVSNHYGTIDGGHYTAFCKSPQQTWYKFDDHEVYDISREAVKTNAAYILFYETTDNKTTY